MSNEDPSEFDTLDHPDESEEDYSDFISQIESLESELSTLRSRQTIGSRYRRRRVGVGFAVMGIAAFVLTRYLQENEELLLILSGTGLFAFLLVFFLTPGQLIPAAYTERMVNPPLRNQQELINEMDLHKASIYVPLNGERRVDDSQSVVVYVPKFEDYTIPPRSYLRERMIETNSVEYRGLSFHPSGAGLLEDFESTLSSGLSSKPSQLAPQLIDGLVNSIEMVDSGQENLFLDENRAEFRLSNPSFDNLDTFDNPIVSFIGSGMAEGLDLPVEVMVYQPPQDGSGDTIIECNWSIEAQ